MQIFLKNISFAFLCCFIASFFIVGCNSTNTKVSSEDGWDPNVLENPVFAGVDVPNDVKKEVWMRDGGKCKACKGTHALGFKHKVSPAKNGKNTADNIEVSCKNCYGAN